MAVYNEIVQAEFLEQAENTEVNGSKRRKKATKAQFRVIAGEADFVTSLQKAGKLALVQAERSLPACVTALLQHRIDLILKKVKKPKLQELVEILQFPVDIGKNRDDIRAAIVGLCLQPRSMIEKERKDALAKETKRKEEAEVRAQSRVLASKETEDVLRTLFQEHQLTTQNGDPKKQTNSEPAGLLITSKKDPSPNAASIAWEKQSPPPREKQSPAPREKHSPPPRETLFDLDLPHPTPQLLTLGWDDLDILCMRTADRAAAYVITTLFELGYLGKNPAPPNGSLQSGMSRYSDGIALAESSGGRNIPHASQDVVVVDVLPDLIALGKRVKNRLIELLLWSRLGLDYVGPASFLARLIQAVGIDFFTHQAGIIRVKKEQRRKLNKVIAVCRLEYNNRFYKGFDSAKGGCPTWMLAAARVETKVGAWINVARSRLRSGEATVEEEVFVCERTHKKKKRFLLRSLSERNKNCEDDMDGDE